ncbi:kinase-like domain-containing protein [Hyaloraphidium curvatum]|nr:kinase-like domain-containing protein [Hyaloraphidium curvatum]
MPDAVLAARPGICMRALTCPASQGSFAHVYLAETVTGERVVLKRIVVPEEEALVTIMREIQVMKDVSFCDKIVQYIDASIEAMPSGGFEALLLMEYCPGGPVVDLMNTRLQTRFTEEEVLRIFGDACEAVASLHYQSPPLLHRDIKVENILVSAFGTYKLCDFGSATSETVAENAALNSRLVGEIEEDIERNTTLQYRAPEMIDLYQRLGLNEKVDIWALGILLYKLCFFGTPFDDGNKLAILNCRYQIPSQPTYSPDLVQLIRMVLHLDSRSMPYVSTCRLDATTLSQQATQRLRRVVGSLQITPGAVPNRKREQE